MAGAAARLARRLVRKTMHNPGPVVRVRAGRSGDIVGNGSGRRWRWGSRGGLNLLYQQVLRAFARQAHVDAIVDFEIVGEHERAGAVHRIGETNRVAEYLLRRALKPEIIGVDDRAIHGDGMHNAQLLELAHE